MHWKPAPSVPLRFRDLVRGTSLQLEVLLVSLLGIVRFFLAGLKFALFSVAPQRQTGKQNAQRLFQDCRKDSG